MFRLLLMSELRHCLILLGVLEVFWFYATLIIFVDNNNNNNKLYNQRLCISSAKKKDLISLIHSNVIPEEYTDFYAKLPSSSNMNDRLPYPSADEVVSASSTGENFETYSLSTA